jgi:DNA-binding PadR family transcriptional regulator
VPRDAFSGHVDLLLLSVLERGPDHGYALIDALRHRSGGVFDLAEGTVYPALYRLERAGLVASTWREVAGRRRRVYRLTRRGGEALRRRRSEWREQVRALEAVLA